MSRRYEYVLQDLDLRHKTILDAAVGAAEATVHWARRIHEQGGTSKIIAVDNDLNEKWIARIHKTLGEYDRYVELRTADIFDLDFLKPESVDIVNCDDTIVFLNDPPLRLLAAFKELDRVLKRSGLLIIISETPISLDDPANEGEWRRWQLAKAIWALSGETWSTEPRPEDVSAALELLGYEVYDRKKYPAGKWFDGLDLHIDEWRGIMLRRIARLPWPDLKEPLRLTVEAVRNKVLADGFGMCPPTYVLKCRKPARPEPRL